MECKDCKYNYMTTIALIDEEYKGYSCSITHRLGTKSCNINNDNEVEDMDICYNCKHWLGGGDWGLSCRKNYYMATTDGFNEVCEQFERK